MFSGVTGGMIIWGEFSSSLHCVLNPLIYFHTNLTFRKFLLRPFRGTVLEKTKFFTKYNDTGTTRQNLNVPSAIILQKNPRLDAATRPSSSIPRISLTKINNLSLINENSVVKPREPINRKILAPTISSVTDNTILSQSDLYSVPDTNTIMSQSEFSVGGNTVMSEFSVVSHDYEELWETNNDCFELRQNTIWCEPWDVDWDAGLKYWCFSLVKCLRLSTSGKLWYSSLKNAFSFFCCEYNVLIHNVSFCNLQTFIVCKNNLMDMFIVDNMCASFL